MSPVFCCGGRRYRVFANLGDQWATRPLDAGLRYDVDLGLCAGEQTLSLEPGQSRLFLESLGELPEVIGGTSHLLPGADVESLEWEAGGLLITRLPGASSHGELLLRVPGGTCRVAGREYRAREEAGGWVLELPVSEIREPPEP